MGERRNFLSAIIAGCGTMPHVGAHPGTGPAIFLIAVTAAAGAQGAGWRGAVIGGTIALLVYGPMYLAGAYSRARVSDRKRGS